MEPWSIRDVLAWERTSEKDQDWQISARYSGSWLLVYWLYNTRAEYFARYQALLAQGADPETSLRDIFPELYYKDIDSHLLEYLRSGSYQELTVKVPAVSMSFSERALEDAEVHAVRAKLAGLAAAMTEQEERSKTRRALAEAERAESVRLEPHSVLALREKLAAAPEAEQPAIARAAVEAHPDDSEAWLLLASALRKDVSGGKEREAAYQKALELSPRSAQAANGLAWLYVTQKRYPEALPVAKRAVALAPWSALILDTYAMAAAGTGACADARLAEQRAIDLLQEHRQPELEKELRHRLAAFGKESCTPPDVEE